MTSARRAMSWEQRPRSRRAGTPVGPRGGAPGLSAPGVGRSSHELGSAPGVVIGDRATVGQQLAVVVEEDHAVAQQLPALLRVTGDDDCEVAVVAGGVRARGRVGAHRSLLGRAWPTVSRYY